MNVWEPLIFFEGEDQAALKAEFIQLSVRHKHNHNFTTADITKYIFRDLKEPELRALQAADRWSKDLEIQDAIFQQSSFNDAASQREQVLQLAMDIAKDTKGERRDRLIALRLVAEMNGDIVKAVDKKVSYAGGTPGSGKATFMFTVDPDADKPPQDVEGDDE